jgi:hypothetical protein
VEKRFGISEESFGKYDYLLISKFSAISREARLIFERFAEMKIEKKLLEVEKDFLTKILYNREAALAWDFTYCGRVRPEVVLPQKIKTVPYKVWQVLSFPIPRALKGKVIKMLNDRIKRGMLERSEGPYRNLWFLAKKKDKISYRLINVAMEMNRVTIRDANMPPSADEFAEEFFGCAVISLVNFFFRYD